MRNVRRRAVLCSIAIALGPVLFAQTLPLNPTVKVLRKPTSIVPTDCEEGLAPAKPLPPVEETPEQTIPAATTAAPPTSDLRTKLRRVQSAAETGDYNAFKSALGEARAAASAYPGGGEKQAANDALQVYSDLERLWDYSVTDRSGAFFTASSDDGRILNDLRKYPNFPRAVADATMTIGGQTVYPSRETRQFLIEEAARRLRSIGVRTPTRVVQETPRVTPAPTLRRVTPKHLTAEKHVPKPSVPKETASKHAATHRAHKPSEKSVSKPAAKPPVKIAEGTVPKQERTTRHEEPAVVSKPVVQPPTKPAPAAAPVSPAPVPPPPVTTTTAPVTTTTAPPPTPATTTTAAAPTTTTEPTTNTSTTATTATTATASTESTESNPATTSSAPGTQPQTQSGGMNLTFAIILIVVGVGVLIVLFRASD